MCRRYWHKTLYIVACLSTTLSVLMFVVFGLFVSSNHKFLMAWLKPKTHQEPHHVCVPCELLADRHQTELVANLTRESKDGLELCCARDWRQLSQLLSLALQIPERHTEVQIDTERILPVSSVSAHLKLTKPNGIVNAVDHTVPLTFNTTDETVHHLRHVEILDTGLDVVHPGIYFTYSSLLFLPNTSSKCGQLPIKLSTMSATMRDSRSGKQTNKKKIFKHTWVHKLVLTRADNSRVDLLESYHTCCHDCHGQEETSYLGGVFYFNARDHLQVQVTDYWVAYLNKNYSFYGLAMIWA